MVSFPTQELTEQFALLKDLKEIDMFITEHYKERVVVIDEYYHTLDCAYSKAWMEEGDFTYLTEFTKAFPARCCMRPPRVFPVNIEYETTTSQKMEKEEEEEKLVLPSSKGLLERPVKQWREDRKKYKRNVRWNNTKIVHEFVCKLLDDVKIPYDSPYVITEAGDEASMVLKLLDCEPDDRCDVRRTKTEVFRSALRDAVDAINECDKDSGYYLNMTNSFHTMPVLSVKKNFKTVVSFQLVLL